MSEKKTNGANGSSHDSRIDELKQKARELAGGEMDFRQSEDCPPDVAEDFLEHIIAYEEAPWTTHVQQLEEVGIQLPAPDSMNDEQLNDKLWEVINQLARMRIFISQTDHLSDRELYTTLWVDALREEVKDMPFSEFSAWHIDLLSSGSEEDTYLYLKYFADEEWRREWLESFPDYLMPDHEEPPYDRDRFLPQANYAIEDEGEDSSETEN